jgi:hypothetical protein
VRAGPSAGSEDFRLGRGLRPSPLALSHLVAYWPFPIEAADHPLSHGRSFSSRSLEFAGPFCISGGGEECR